MGLNQANDRFPIVDKALNLDNKHVFEAKNRVGETVYHRENSASGSKGMNSHMIPQSPLPIIADISGENGGALPVGSNNSSGFTRERRIEAPLDLTQVPETNIEEQIRRHIMSKEDIDNDDLFDELEQPSLERTISDPIISPSPLNIMSNKELQGSGSSKGTKSPSPSNRRPASERLEYPKFQVPKGVHRKIRSDHKTKKYKFSRELSGMASKKWNALLVTGSPKVKDSLFRRTGRQSSMNITETKRKPSSTSRSLFPRHEVLASAIS